MSQETTNRSFDDLARAVAEGSISRRRALRLFAGTAIAALIPSTRAMAAITCPPGTVKICHVPQRADGTCRRGEAQTRCVSPENAARHASHRCDCCGGCGGTDDCRERRDRTCFSTSTTTTSTSTTTPTTSTTPPPVQPCTPGTLCAGRQGTCYANASGVGTTCGSCGPGGSCTTSCDQCSASQACVILSQCTEAQGVPLACVPRCPGT